MHPEFQFQTAASKLAAVVAACFLMAAVHSGTVEAAKAKFNKVVVVGEKSPDWNELPGVDGERHGLGDYSEAKAVVVVFTCNHCPVAKMYEDRLIELSRKYGKQVQVVAICVSHVAADRLDKMKIRAKEKEFPFAYLYDESQESARRFGATVTPHFFLLDGTRKIAYMGAFDDNFDVEKVEKHYLVDALEALLDEKEPRVKESLQRGCAIGYESANRLPERIPSS